MTRNRVLAFAAAAIVALGIAAWAVYRVVDGRTLAYDFHLTDQDGRPFALSDERGKAVAVFFGYTHCPDECPATLAHLASARASLGAKKDDVRVVFVTVDPRRDTPAVMKKYLSNFDPSFIGVTGTPDQLAPVYRAYHVWYQPLPNTKKGLEDLEAHTATIYIVDRGGHLKRYDDWADSTADLARDLRAAS